MCMLCIYVYVVAGYIQFFTTSSQGLHTQHSYVQFFASDVIHGVLVPCGQIASTI